MKKILPEEYNITKINKTKEDCFMIYSGVDYHKARSHITAIREDGELIWRSYVANNKESINEMLKNIATVMVLLTQ